MKSPTSISEREREREGEYVCVCERERGGGREGTAPVCSPIVIIMCIPGHLNREDSSQQFVRCACLKGLEWH